MGTQINKGARKGACRDLSGRRMRDVDAEKKYVYILVELRGKAAGPRYLRSWIHTERDVLSITLRCA